MSPSFAVNRATWLRLTVLAGVVMALAGFLGWQSGETPAPAAARPAPAKWTLPNFAPEDRVKDLAELNARHPWSNPSGAAGAVGVGDKGRNTAQGPPLQWRLAGIVERLDGKLALIATGQPGSLKFEYRNVGDQLPDGSTLVEITADSAVARSDGAPGEQRVYRLFRRKS